MKSVMPLTLTTKTRHPLLSIKPIKKIREECPQIVDASMTANALALLLGDIRGAGNQAINNGAEAKQALKQSAAKALLKELTLQINELVA